MRVGLSEEIAAAVVFMVSDDALYFHRAFLTIDDGAGAF